MSTPFVSFTSRTTLQPFCTISNYPTQGTRHAFYKSPEKNCKSVNYPLLRGARLARSAEVGPVSVLLGGVHPRESRPASTHNESIYTIAYVVTLGLIVLEACGNQLQLKCWRPYTSRRMMQLLASAPTTSHARYAACASAAAGAQPVCGSYPDLEPPLSSPSI
ncbi:hypothetical protein CC77DRAFT_370784 [Alternaria alternata]|jgi:hypothetical protein|uniref:Uncharacterized protein n=1 Tax=Alternaria alternata TaxID=5599 RepID=A0A177DD16_ALTAL|nr:hypothetical protein CC77DRAFT_370784 [Alternaria alternata]OAG17012.1 hypothetical protein CC77DRAFT_370784 [Alternaria alternata]